MRERISRGKRVDNGEWVEGFYVNVPEHYKHEMSGKSYIVSVNNGLFMEVVPETVGDYTGVRDKNDKRIFEGDIVRLHYFYTAYDYNTLGAYEEEDTLVATIRIWDMGVGFDRADGKGCGYLHELIESPQDEIEVIGTIHDNPELLEEEK